jgi:class 3 adenylate cyclase
MSQSHRSRCLAAVIGKHKFAYDVYGDTVNVASRMESHGAAGKIQVSEDTYLRLKNGNRCEPRGTVELKGRGPMLTYWLDVREPATYSRR